MLEIKVCSMRARGKIGYVAKILPGVEREFLGASHTDRYSTSAQTLTYKIDEDGIYEICDANYGGTRKNTKYLNVQNGEIQFENENLHQLLFDWMDIEPELNFAGTIPQCNYAQAIWLKGVGEAIAKHFNNPEKMELVKMAIAKAQEKADLPAGGFIAKKDSFSFEKFMELV